MLLRQTYGLARVCNLTRMLLRQTCVDCNRRKISRESATSQGCSSVRPASIATDAK
jgi:hypothetical protein